jgi:hypothetical protein
MITLNGRSTCENTTPFVFPSPNAGSLWQCTGMNESQLVSLGIAAIRGENALIVAHSCGLQRDSGYSLNRLG